MKLPRIPLTVQLVVFVALFIGVEWLSTKTVPMRTSLTAILIFWGAYIVLRIALSRKKSSASGPVSDAGSTSSRPM